MIHALQHNPRTVLPNCINEVVVAATQVRIRLNLVGAGLQQAGVSNAETVLEVLAERKPARVRRAWQSTLIQHGWIDVAAPNGS